MAIPKYQQIKDELKQQIISGKFENGDKFYTEAELIQMFNVSSITVVRALNELANDGYIIRQQGKGTFVSRARKHKLVEFSDVETFPIQKDKVTVLSIKRGNDLKILDKLELAPTQFYYKIDRIRRTGDKVYIYHQTYIPEQYINPNYPDMDYYSSIYNRFKTDYHIHMNDEHFWRDQWNCLPNTKRCCESVGSWYQLPNRSSGKITQLESTGQILEYSETYKRGDFFKI